MLRARAAAEKAAKLLAVAAQAAATAEKILAAAGHPETDAVASRVWDVRTPLEEARDAAEGVAVMFQLAEAAVRLQARRAGA